MLKPHEQRVVDELVELDERTRKLELFLKTELFQSLEDNEKNLLLGQFGAMCSYLALLQLRAAKYEF